MTLNYRNKMYISTDVMQIKKRKNDNCVQCKSDELPEHKREHRIRTPGDESMMNSLQGQIYLSVPLSLFHTITFNL